MTEAIVRSAADHDLSEVLKLYRHLHPHDPPLETATAERVWLTLLTSSFMTVIVAQAAELLVSSCTLAIVPNLSRGGRSYGVIENVVTHADYRLGLGRRVLAHAIDVAWQADCYKVLWRRSKRRPPCASMRERAFIVGQNLLRSTPSLACSFLNISRNAPSFFPLKNLPSKFTSSLSPHNSFTPSRILPFHCRSSATHAPAIRIRRADSKARLRHGFPERRIQRRHSEEQP